MTEEKFMGVMLSFRIQTLSERTKERVQPLGCEKVTWIITKTITANPLLQTFNEKEPPRFIKIPGEQGKT